MLCMSKSFPTMNTEEQEPGWVLKSNNFPPTNGRPTTEIMTVFSPIEVENTIAELEMIHDLPPDNLSTNLEISYDELAHVDNVSEDGQTVNDNVSKEGNE